MATLKEVLENEATAKELFAQETGEAALAYLKGKGVEITLPELKAALEEMQSGELSDDDLAGVAGGGVVRAPSMATLMHQGKGTWF